MRFHSSKMKLENTEHELNFGAYTK